MGADDGISKSGPMSNVADATVGFLGGNFNIRRSCLSEITLLSRPKKLSIIGYRQPEDWQYA